MQVLVYLAEHAGRAVSRRELEAHIWTGRIVTEDAVTNTILKLRRAFGDDARNARVIETIPKTGYRLIAEVTPAAESHRETRAAAITSAPKRGKGLRLPLILAGGMSLILCLLWWVWYQPGGGRPTAEPARDSPDRPALAILPFRNLGAAPQQDYFANGITADLITDLSKVSGLLVIAPGSVFAYKDSDAGPRQISAELDVDYVVVGSVQRSGELLRINVQLIEAKQEQALWGERYEGIMGDIFSVQDRLTAAVISALKVELEPREREFLARRPTASVAAYDHYLRGLEAHGHRSRDQNLLAKEHFLRAIELDPQVARAYTGLALTHSRDAIDGWTETPSQSLERAAELAQQAVRMNPSLPQVHFVSGQVDLFRHRHEQAIEATRRAIRVDPNYADAYALSAWVLNYVGRPHEALAAMERAMRLNPRPTASYLEVLGEIRFAQGRYNESVSVFESVLDINPNYTRARMWIAAALAHAGAGERAEWETIELMVLNPNVSLSRLGFAFPFKDERVLESLLEGLKKAGLPE